MREGCGKISVKKSYTLLDFLGGGLGESGRDFGEEMAVEGAGDDIWRRIDWSFWVGMMMMMGRGCD